MKRVDKQYLKIIEKDDTVSKTLDKLPYFFVKNNLGRVSDTIGILP